MWTLQIKYPQISDSGTYECQINTEPKMSLSYTFNVVGKYFFTNGFILYTKIKWMLNGNANTNIMYSNKIKKSSGGALVKRDRCVYN